VAAYIMVKQMDGDETLASGSITVSTLLSAFSLATALWLTS
jgi:predicted permease